MSGNPAQRLIAAVVYHPGEYDEVKWVTPDDFSNPHEGYIWQTIQAIMEEESGIPPDLMTETLLRITSNGRGPAAGAAWNDIVHKDHPGPNTATYYAQHVTEQAIKRRVMNAADRAVQLAADSDPQNIIPAMRDHWDASLSDLQAGPAQTRAVDCNDFVAVTEAPGSEWVIPGLLQRGERAIVVAPVKAGKSTLSRQIALCTAAGAHPLNPTVDAPRRRVLYVDLENPVGVVRKELKRQMSRLPSAVEVGWLRIWSKEDGIDLGSHADRAQLEREIEEFRPDLVILSPLYKAYLPKAGESWDQQARGAQRPIDTLRAKYNCAWWIEHHASKSDATGLFGAAQWAWWLDLKIALVPEDKDAPPPYERMMWEATYRDAGRLCPTYIEWGKGLVPWLARFPENFATALAKAVG
jgi:hypothetical protein